MAEDQRVARNNGEPPKSGEGGWRRWADYLDWQREEIASGVLALTEAEQRTARLPSGWTPVELLSHVLHMEQRWFVWGFLGEPVEAPWGDWNVAEPWLSDDSDETRPAARWQAPENASVVELVELVARLRAVGDRTRAVLGAHPLDQRAAPGGRFGEDPPTLDWICFHVLAEYARHAGHLDVAVELLRADLA